MRLVGIVSEFEILPRKGRFKVAFRVKDGDVDSGKHNLWCCYYWVEREEGITNLEGKEIACFIKPHSATRISRSDGELLVKFFKVM